MTRNHRLLPVSLRTCTTVSRRGASEEITSADTCTPRLFLRCCVKMPRILRISFAYACAAMRVDAMRYRAALHCGCAAALRLFGNHARAWGRLGVRSGATSRASAAPLHAPLRGCGATNHALHAPHLGRRCRRHIALRQLKQTRTPWRAALAEHHREVRIVAKLRRGNRHNIARRATLALSGSISVTTRAYAEGCAAWYCAHRLRRESCDIFAPNAKSRAALRFARLRLASTHRCLLSRTPRPLRKSLGEARSAHARACLAAHRLFDTPPHA